MVYWNHHLTQVYLAATKQKWKDDLAERIERVFVHFVTYSRGTTVASEHHWMSRPRACAYYRFVQYVNGQATPDKRYSRIPIINFTWDKAQALAVTQPPKRY